MNLSNNLTLIVKTSGAFSVAVITVVASPLLTYAADFSVQGGADAARGNDQVVDLFGTTGVFQEITNILLFLVGVISVIMLIIGGLRYVISGGNSSSVTAAKNTILYAIIGIIVAVLAYAIVNFVIGSLTPGSGSDV